MNKKVISYDLGTGGIKASIYDISGSELSSSFIAYDTYYPKVGWHEQSPNEWWDAVVLSTKNLINDSKIDVNEIESLAISGHSLGVVPIGKDGSLLRDKTPIWSDTRAVNESNKYFKEYDYKNWYEKTGSGFPANLYSIFKIMWYKENEPQMYEKVNKFIGTKDYINYKLTGVLCTDNSYASGSGVYDLVNGKYDDELIKPSLINKDVLPDIVPSTHIVGNLTKEASKELGLPEDVKVMAGGVDNSCMALGARGIKDGRVYLSLGSSAWIAATTYKPIIDFDKKPYVFAHVIDGMYTSATSIFSAGSSHRWVCNELCKNLKKNEKNPFVSMEELAEKSPIGANKLIFNPSLAGGSGLDKSPNIRGGFIGLDLKHSQGDIIRSTMEGISLNLRLALDALNNIYPVSSEMLVVGGGAKSSLWMQIFADVFNMNMIRTNVGQNAGSLGAAAIALVGSGMWDSFDNIDTVHNEMKISSPIRENNYSYETILPVFEKIAELQSDIGEYLYNMEI